MKIREQQMAAFTAARIESFERDACAYLRRWYPDDPHTLADVDLQSFVRLGTRKACAYNIRSEMDTMRFIELLLTVGTDFDTGREFSWLSELLTYQLAAEERLDMVCEHIRFEGWLQQDE